jgi:uncharacterized membrane protein
MAEVAKKPRRRTRQRGHDEESPRADVEGTADDAKSTAEDTTSEAEDTAGQAADGKPDGLFSELRGTVRDAALEVLKPVAREATTTAAKFAATKGPDLVKDKVVPMVAKAGGPGAIAKGALEKGGDVAGGLTEKIGKKGGKKPTGHGRGRRLPVQEHIDVGVDLETAYDQWTQFEDFPKFMHRVEKIEQKDDTTLMWHENIWGVRRSWEAEIVEQKPCERIVWRGKGQTETVGVVTFHRLSDRLTRIQVNLDFQPKGLFEKTASGFRLSRKALRSDLMRFKAFIEMKDEPTGAWRGLIEDGEVQEREDQGDEPRDEAEDEPRDEAEEGEEGDEDEPEDEDEELDEEEDEPEAEADEDEPEEEEEEEPEPEPKPKRRRRTTAGSRRR